MKTSPINRVRLPVAFAAVAAAAAWMQPLSAGEGEHAVTGKAVVIRGDAPVAWQGKHVVEIRNDDGDVTIKLDGEDLPSGRIRMEEGRIIILDPDGNEMKSFGLLMPQEGDFEFSFDWDGAGNDDFNAVWTGADEDPPTVMIGIQMSEPDEALRYHLRLEAGQATMIAGIYEGLPAQAAGLERYDVIVAVEGARPANPEAIGLALADKEPGDTVTLTVIHQGKSRDFDVELAAFDAERLGDARLIGGISPDLFAPDEGMLFQGPGEKQWQRYLFDPNTQQYFLKWFDSEQLQEQLSDALRKRLPQDLDDRMHDLNERIDQLQEMIDELLERGRTGGGSGMKRTEGPLVA